MNKISICLINSMVLMILSVLVFMLGFVFYFMELVYLLEWEILSINSSSIYMCFLFDWMSLLFMSFVLFISSSVIYYSMDYMTSDKFLNRFIYLVVLFVFSMVMLIVSPNLISILLGWDGLGLVSYCLVVYFQNSKSFSAGMLTALTNRVGDVALLLGIAWMLNFGGWSFFNYLSFMSKDSSMNVIGMLVFIAAITKSAQIPFSSWLPAAMAAPTPVSALVHSSTLVTAGVYLLIRFNLIFLDSYLGVALLLVSSMTMFMAGLGASFEFDFKKIIALSTLSQLGLMMSTLAIGFPLLAYFHLLTHALFKALLFLCAGSVIHSMKNSQDIRDLGGLIVSMPLSAFCFSASSLALCGLPFLAGFYSKDMILEMVMMSEVNFLSFSFFFISTGLTVCYSFRLVYYSLTGEFNQSSLNCLNEESFVMMKSLCGLIILVIFSGGMMSWVIFTFMGQVYLPLMMKNLILMVCFLGGGAGYYLSISVLFFMNKSLKFYYFSVLNNMMWFLPLLSTLSLVKLPLKMSKEVYKSVDSGWTEKFGGQGAYMSLKGFSSYNYNFQDNSLKVYFLVFIFWILYIFLFMIVMYLNILT